MRARTQSEARQLAVGQELCPEKGGRRGGRACGKAYIFLGKDHGNLASHRPNVDTEVKVHENACVSHRGVNNDALALADIDAQAVLGVLLRQPR